MAFCTNCGTQVADGVKFCTTCGAPMNGGAAQPEPQAQQPQPQPQPQAAQQQQVYQQQPQQQAYRQQPYQQPYQQPQPQYQPQPAYQPPYVEEPISTGDYIGIFLLMMIPLVNLICLIVWACGGCKKVNKRNLSRAMLVLMLIGIGLGILVTLAGGLLFGDVFNELGELGKALEQ